MEAAAAGSISSGGEYTAPASGTGKATVTATAGGLTASALIEYGTYVGKVYYDANGVYSYVDGVQRRPRCNRRVLAGRPRQR